MADEKEKDSAEETASVNEQELGDVAEKMETNETQKMEITRLNLEIGTKEKLLQESVDRAKRLHADFDNFRRRTQKEREELSIFAVQGLMKDLLPLLDNFERALAAEAAENSSFKEGVEMIAKQMLATLEKNGLERINAIGEKFDPNFHEAIMRVADDSKEDDTVAEELQKGYSLRGRVLRPSMVKVVGN